MRKSTLIIVGVAIVGSGYFFQRAWRGANSPAGVSSSGFFAEQLAAFQESRAPRKDFKAGAPVSPGSSTQGPASGTGWSLSNTGKGGANAVAPEEPASFAEDRVREELRKPLSPNEVESVTDLLSILVSHNADDTTPADLVKQLERAGLKPEAAVDENSDTGKMVTVRTGDALPGTRYFHAQFFEDEHGRMQAQHISFEVRPGPDSEEVAQNLIRKTFVGIGKPTTERGCFREWKTKGCKTVWMKCLSAEDMTDHPFNAYDPARDKGTILVAQQDDPHCHEAAAEHQ